ncbi:MAG: carbon monoxide dehydrogenase [Ruminococcaceae bacterium]|jgi:CO dehydrogenase/acetyl-CoA synthase beta subunit|nr:carbon monoxide dehydrogenase [Oscillospiraceae bacterium]
MELYNSIITATRALLSGADARRWDYDGARAWRDTGESELVMLRDAAFELGGGNCPSANFTCVTSDESLVPKDEILLYGKDLPELRGDVSFARLAFLLSDDLGGDDEAAYQAIRDMEFVKYHVFPEGYMVRISSESNREQVRLSKAAIARGIDFRSVGAAYIKGYHKNPHVRRVQLVFITDSSVVAELGKTAKKVDGITRTLTHILEGIPTDCGSCDLKPICDEVEGMREMHFGMKNKG